LKKSTWAWYREGVYGMLNECKKKLKAKDAFEIKKGTRQVVTLSALPCPVPG